MPSNTERDASHAQPENCVLALLCSSWYCLTSRQSYPGWDGPREIILGTVCGLALALPPINDNLTMPISIKHAHVVTDTHITTAGHEPRIVAGPNLDVLLL